MSKMVRPLSVFVMVVMFVCIFAVPVSAESVYANIKSASVSVEIPKEFTVTSASINPDDSTTYSAVATMNDTSKQLYITSEKNSQTSDLYNYKYMTEKDINSEVENIRSGNQTMCGYTFQNVTAASFKEQSKYILFTFYNSEIKGNLTVYSAISYTLVNGELITVKFTSTSNALTDTEKVIFNKIVDSINVATLYEKPLEMNMSSVFGTLLVVAIFVGIGIIIILVGYYVTHRSTNVKGRRRLADKYYDELKSEGLMDESEDLEDEIVAVATSTIIEPSEKVLPKDRDQISALLESTSGTPSLIEDEWEDIDLEKMFAIPEFDSDTNEYKQNVVQENLVENLSDMHENDTIFSAQSGRADSAKRYAKMFIGSDIDHKENNTDEKSSDPEYDEKMARIEERHRQRMSIKKSKGKKRKHSSHPPRIFSESKRTNHRSSVSARRTTTGTDIFGEFEIDSYWDKYR
ncbi:MAG: hypothetical protein UIM53_06695 [Acutalibacteraceae bacterium]|nr:hypothetical protein [Acutalibacteraceae bacterium]